MTIDDKELELCNGLCTKAIEAVGHALERVWPSFYADLLAGGWENTLTIKLSVEKYNSTSGSSTVLTVGWLPKPKVIDKDFPAFEVDGSQLTIDFDKPAEDEASNDETSPVPADETCPVPPASAVGEYPPDIMEKLHLWMEAASEMGLPLYMPCQHKGVPNKGNLFDRWEGNKCTSCAPLPTSKPERDKTFNAMLEDGLVAFYVEGLLMFSRVSIQKLTDYGFALVEQNFLDKKPSQWRIWGSTAWNDTQDGAPVTCDFRRGEIPFALKII